jgi:hypothetical protein
MVLLDTAAALSSQGRLTAFCVETSGYLQVTRSLEQIEGSVKA